MPKSSLIEWLREIRVKIRPFPLFFVLAAAGISALFLCAKRPPHDRELRVYLRPLARSSDPLDLEGLSNSRTLNGVRSGLVGVGKLGEIQGLLAKRWEAANDFRVWKFTFRRGMTFETGEEIRPADLAASWVDLARELRRRRSRGGPLQALIGYESPEPNGGIAGLTYDEDSITLRFAQPQPKLLTQLAKAQYAVTHPGCRDPVTRAWRCARKAVSSGPYRIETWTDQEVTLRLRDDFPREFRHPNAAESIRIGESREFRETANAIFRHSGRPAMPEGFRFAGGMSSSIGYAYCVSWRHKTSPCRDLRERRILRDRFFHFIQGKSEDFRWSFLPLAVPGVREGKIPNPLPLGAVPGMTGTLRVEAMTNPEEPTPSLRRGFLETTESLGMRLVEVPVDESMMLSNLARDRSEYDYDLVFFAGTIDQNDPTTSIRKMFLSEEGARLPDPTGRISRELHRAHPDFGRINDLVWEDAIVWPMGYVGLGIWVRDEIDLSLYNPATGTEPLHWLGLR